MITVMTALALSAVQTPAAAPVGDPALGRLAALYDQLCLKAFPDDAAVAAALDARGAKPLTREQIAVTLRDDPGRGWLLRDGERNIQITLELPPFHACSVRRTVRDGAPTGDTYQAAIGTYKASHPGFVAAPPLDAKVDKWQVHAAGVQRILPGGGGESLLVIEQRPQAGADGTLDLRYVHQIRTGPAPADSGQAGSQ